MSQGESQGIDVGRGEKPGMVQVTWVFPKIGGKPQNWMVKIMENPIIQWMIWGENPLFLETSTYRKMMVPLRYLDGPMEKNTGQVGRKKALEKIRFEKKLVLVKVGCKKCFMPC